LSAASAPLTVRRFAPGETAALRTIRREALAIEPAAFGSSLVEEWDMAEEQVEAWIDDNLIIGAFAGREAVAMAGLRRLRRHKVRHRAELWGVYVRRAWRGTGTADRLMEVLLELCDRDIRQVELNVVEGHSAALAFYRRHGFRESGRIPNATVTEGGYADEIVMTRWLD
tara:strand:- start:207 stop:716 length:510 start_codon:yes stop_codon:yes gene_type:complete